MLHINLGSQVRCQVNVVLIAILGTNIGVVV